jgi:hypothetical protein
MSVSVVAQECTAEGPGLTGKWTAQQVRSSFTITARAAGGQPVGLGGETFRVKVRGQGSVDPEVKDREDGTYQVELTYPISGKYEVLISLDRNKTPISGSPFTVNVQSARRPPAPAPPRLGALTADGVPTLEWEPPEHTGGMPLTGYTVVSAQKGDPNLLGQLGPEVLSFPLPAAGGASTSAWYYGFQVSASNAKGEGERSAPGPRPTPFDSARLDAERAALLKTFDTQTEAGGDAAMVVETYCGRASASGELAAIAASHPSRPSLVAEALGRLRRAGAARDNEVGGGALGGVTAVRADIDGATGHEIAVALILHVWDVLMPGGKDMDERTLQQLGGAPNRQSFLACVEGDERGQTILDGIPQLAEALGTFVAASPQAPLGSKEIEGVARGALPPIPIELEVIRLKEAAAAAATAEAAEAAERARQEAQEAAERAKQEAVAAAERARQEAEARAERARQEAAVAAERARQEAAAAAERARQEVEEEAERARQVAATAAEHARREAEAAAERARLEAEAAARQRAATLIQARLRGMLARRVAAKARARREIEEQARCVAEEKARRDAEEAAAATTIQRFVRGRVGRGRLAEARAAREAENARRLALHEESKVRVRQSHQAAAAVARLEELAGQQHRAAVAAMVADMEAKKAVVEEAREGTAAEEAAAEEARAAAAATSEVARVRWEQETAAATADAAAAVAAEAVKTKADAKARADALAAVDAERESLLGETHSARQSVVSSKRRLLALENDAVAAVAAAAASDNEVTAVEGQLEELRRRKRVAEEGEAAAEVERFKLESRRGEHVRESASAAVALLAIAASEAEAVADFEKERAAFAPREATEREAMAEARTASRCSSAAAEAIDREVHELEEACAALQRQVHARVDRSAAEAAQRQAQATALQQRVKELEAKCATAELGGEVAAQVLQRAAAEAEAEWRPRSEEVAALAQILASAGDAKSVEIRKVRQEAAQSLAAAQRAAEGVRTAEFALPARRKQAAQQQATRQRLEEAAAAAVAAATTAAAATKEEATAMAAVERSANGAAAAAKREQQRKTQVMAAQVDQRRDVPPALSPRVQREAAEAPLWSAKAALSSLLAGCAEAEAARCADLLRAVPAVRAAAEEAALAKRNEEASAVAMGALPMAAAAAAAAAREAEVAAAAAEEAVVVLKRCRAEAAQEAEEARREVIEARRDDNDASAILASSQVASHGARGGDKGVAGGRWGGLLSPYGWQSEAVRTSGLDLQAGVRMVLSDGSPWVVTLLQLPPRPATGGGDHASRPQMAEAQTLPPPSSHIFACAVGEGPARGVVHCCEELCFMLGPQLWRACVVEAPLGFQLWRYDALATAEGAVAPCRSTVLNYTNWEGVPGRWLLPSAVQWCPSGACPRCSSTKPRPHTCTKCTHRRAPPRLCCRQSRQCVRRTFLTPRANQTGLHFRSSLRDHRRRPR